MFRSITHGLRPNVGARPYGNPYVNFADKQFGVIDQGQVPQDLIGVPFFSPNCNYNPGQPVNYQGQLYVAIATIVGGTWNPLQWTLVSGQSVPACGRLTMSSPSLLRFSPYNGDKIRINGVIYSIPAAGIAGLGNSAVFINGTPSQTLQASRAYWVYCFNNNGVLTADYSPTVSHSTSTTAGNIGTEIKTGDDTRTLIGIVWMNGSAQFQNDIQNRFVRSWFNRPRQFMQSTQPNFGPISGGNWIFISSYMYFCGFADDVVFGAANATFLNQGGSPQNEGLSVWFDNSLTGSASQVTTLQSSVYYHCAASGGSGLGTDGWHEIAVYANTTGSLSGYSSVAGWIG